MRQRKIATMIATMAMSATAIGQSITVSPIGLMEGCSTINPIVVDNKLYFASDKKNDFLVNYFDNDGHRLYQLYQVELKDELPVGEPKRIFVNGNRPYSQTAVSFDAEGRMHVTQSNTSATTSKGAPLAIFDYNGPSDMSDGIPNIKYKDANAAYPSYSRDGDFMVFASDAKNGYGSADLYYCEKKNGQWTEPINMGGIVNTRGAETSPFIHPSGKIFFASNGRADSKKLDIYYTYRVGNDFAEPIRYDIKINSIGDDYGIFIDDNEDWGYFVSNRHGKDRLYMFKQDFPEFLEESEMVTENYCYTFFEETVENYDKDMFSFRWDVDDGFEAEAYEADHCFAGPGDYYITLSVLDKTTGEEMFTIAEYPLHIERPEQINIHIPERIAVGETVEFSADSKNISKFQPTNYYWDFEGVYRTKGSNVKVKFEKEGTFRVRCGTIAEEDNSVRICTYTFITVE